MPRHRKSKARSTIDPGSLPNAVTVNRAPTIRPQLATASERVPQGDQWLHEIKFDGYRLMCYVSGDKARLITRGGLDWTEKFPEVAKAITALPVEDAIFDGELIAVDPAGRSSFNAMQNALRPSKKRQLQAYLFDLPYVNGFDLRRSPLAQRKALLEQIIQSSKTLSLVQYSTHIVGNGDRIYREACERGLEGTISKRADSYYVSSRTSSWLKNKCKHRQEFVIGGYSEPEGSRKGFGALVVGYHDSRGLIYCGRVGTGFDHQTLKSLDIKLKALGQRENPFAISPTGADAKRVHWVVPSLVAEIEFAQWTEDGRLRHPAYVGLREDKPARQVVRETAKATAGGEQVEIAAEAMRDSKAANAVEVAGVRLTNPDRVMYPEVKVTKHMVALYYEAVASRILPHIVNRPLTIVRCPKGLPNKCFYQRHLTETLPAQLRGVSVREGDELVQYIVIEDLAGLISLVQHSALELHPWGSRADDIERPDRLIFDLDPGPDVKWKRVIEAAQTTREILAAANLQSFVQTSGGKGLHVVVPITPRAHWVEARAFCHAVAQLMAMREPTKYTATLSKTKRIGKVFVDYLRNGRGATSVAPFSTRARAKANIAVPICWDELSSVKSAGQFAFRNVRKRLASPRRDQWNGYFDLRQELPSLSRH